MDLAAIQQELQRSRIDGWLFYDFHHRDPIAARILDMDTTRFASRRWFYYIPAYGEPKKLVHRIEPWRCDHLPGQKRVYLSWQELHQALQEIVADASTVAMQYSPLNAVPAVSIVDAGTVDLIRSFGVQVVSSADLVGRFEAHLSMEDLRTHEEAGKLLHEIKDRTFHEIAVRVRNGQRPTEHEIQVLMHEWMKEKGLIWADGPIVAVNEHAADPHFEPSPSAATVIRPGDLLLLDLWAKLDRPRSIYYDITWMAFVGEETPQKWEEIFQIVVCARNAALQLIKDRFAAGAPIYGWEADEACRRVIVEAGYGPAFIHRTGHNIGEQVHGNGVNLDNLETKDERTILPGTCFSIEPGIYLPEKKIGFRSEIDVFVTDEGEVTVYGPMQDNIIPLLAVF
ncbi:MAG: M24 family metallopeptidase [candidate division KSB1 bacterium]|nr:M24 family metallopeptidase [candidate division KSB1 bacterium]